MMGVEQRIITIIFYIIMALISLVCFWQLKPSSLTYDFFRDQGSSLGAIASFLVAVIALIISLRQNIQSRKSNEIQLRAYLSYLGESVRLTLCNTTWVIQVTGRVWNSGQTPARNVVHNFHIRQLPSPLPDDLPIPCPIEIGRPHQAPSIGAGKDAVQEGGHGVDIKIGNLNLGSEKIYIIGIINYEDVFGKSHKLHYCGFIENSAELIDRYIAGGAPPELQFRHSFRGNLES